MKGIINWWSSRFQSHYETTSITICKSVLVSSCSFEETLQCTKKQFVLNVRKGIVVVVNVLVVVGRRHRNYRRSTNRRFLGPDRRRTKDANPEEEDTPPTTAINHRDGHPSLPNGQTDAKIRSVYPPTMHLTKHTSNFQQNERKILTCVQPCWNKWQHDGHCLFM